MTPSTTGRYIVDAGAGPPGTTSADGTSSSATTSRALQRADLVGDEAEEGRAAQEGGVPDGRDHADPRGGAHGVVGGRAHADREAQRGAEPQSTMPATAPAGPAKTIRSTPTAAAAIVDQSTAGRP